jgi:hypothetical protein
MADHESLETYTSRLFCINRCSDNIAELREHQMGLESYAGLREHQMGLES